MSLVSEALRKARQEAAERDAVERGAPPPVIIDRGRPHRGPRLAPVLAGLGLGLAIAVAAWWLLARPAPTAGPDTGTTGGTPAAASAAEPAPASDAPAAAGGPPPQPAEVDEGAPPPAAPRSGEAGGGAAAPRAAAVPTTAPAAVPAPASVPAAGPAAETPGTGTAAGPERTFVLDADLGYAKLHLDYIVFKPSAPFGSVNGQRIVEGTIVDGFLVEEIGRDFVRLRDSRGPLVLRVR